MYSHAIESKFLAIHSMEPVTSESCNLKQNMLLMEEQEVMQQQCVDLMLVMILEIEAKQEIAQLTDK